MDDRRAAQAVRIASAADWLARARQGVEQGDPRRGLLALLLAEAEVRRATEVGLAEVLPRRQAGDGGLLLAASVGAVLAAGAAVLLGGLAATARPRAEVPLPALRLPRPAQTTLHLVDVVQPADRVVERTVVRVVRVPAPAAPALQEATPARREVTTAAAPGLAAAREEHHAQRTPLPASAAPVAPAAPAGPSALVPAAAPAATSASAPTAPAAPPPMLSQADLIDLVLAAERSLRRTVDQ
ncbi:MAG: hypothetical protein QN157_00335 [Armatimonadota bacterium]|nr:hypothetical protein [Armatimonadota bacterium]